MPGLLESNSYIKQFSFPTSKFSIPKNYGDTFIIKESNRFKNLLLIRVLVFGFFLFARLISYFVKIILLYGTGFIFNPLVNEGNSKQIINIINSS